MVAPFILLDDARGEGASPARLYRDPLEIVVARRPEDVAGALLRIEHLAAEGHALAGTIAYEAGLAIEPRLAPLAARRCGAGGPLVWFGAFAGWEEIAAEAVPGWLAEQSGSAPASIGPLDPQLSPGGYLAAFAGLRAAILAGDIYQANLTFPLSGTWRGDPLALYAALRPQAAAGYGGIVFDGSHWLLSLSPELFVALKDDAVTAKPMKGTRPREADPARDAEVAGELAASIKDRAENLMIVDLMRNDLSRVSRPGSVRVERAFAVESYPTVHQMTTTVRARLRSGLGAIDVIRAIFPCGSITGAPKIRAMELIEAVERDARGPYCGAIGRIDPADANGTSDAAFNVAIRTLRLDPGPDGLAGRATMGVGSAIVADSQPLDEWRECVVKGGFVGRSTAAQCDLIETMRFDPAVGVPLIEFHLERMKASAAELGFAFDRHALRNAIQALCFDLEAPSRLRVVAARSGAHAIEMAPLPRPLPVPARVALLPLPVAATDWRLRHKTSDRGFYEEALAVARAAGADEAVFLDAAGLVTEGSFTSVFVARAGDAQDAPLLTPPAALGLLPGVLRASLLGEGRAVEAELRIGDLERGFWIGNALRGLVPARLMGT
ncbi:aminodeoxychorismate synthase component I [Novosphingobium sp. Gsoil 351]|uniref:aminodeoxychorismate synthase component I n=1 Tax=Novosphingobium sp. Gsoil 351 TaxID=2675225 RepID=UPI0012B490C8|nr:aminodeoxychorismate synthase component I [Novosphingobium sp. Gsoil 351]QGN54559.1 aminodeoxychorismate synthase component I [Novosphingobium sp. Gsoil 351]